MSKSLRSSRVTPRSRPRCPECGFKIRSKQHSSGEHHKKGVNGKYTVKSS